ncbi:MAG: DUF1573 domain-containing protein [Ignavibacteriaceae bacterium]
MYKVFYLVIVFAGFAFAQFEPRAVIEPKQYDFGDIQQGEVVTHDFIIKNDGNDVLTIKNVRASCGCTAAQPSKNELKPGESTEVQVSFNSEGRSGKQAKTVYIETNDPASPTVKLSFSGNVVKGSGNTSKTPDISFKETSHDFGKVKQGEIPEYTFKFKNNGKSTLEIKDVKTSCGCTAALISSKKIEPGKEGTIRVELDTKDRSGKMTRNITISSNDPDEPNKILTITAEIIKES